MRRTLIVALAVPLALLAVFGVAHALGWRWLTDDAFVHGELLGRARPLAAAIGVGLLTVDLLLPVVSSPIMLAHGWLYGVFGGTLLNLAGGLGCGGLGLALGRLGGPWLARLLRPEEHARATALLARHGLLALIVTRPVPLLAESVVLAAGAAGLPWGRALPALALGCLPPAFLYALAGAWQAPNLASNLLIFLLVITLAGLTWLATRPRPPRP